MSIEITNLKYSVKLNKHVNLNEVSQEINSEHSNNFKSILHSSFCVIREHGSSLRIILFKKKAHSILQHLNITGLRDPFQFDKTLEKVAKLLKCNMHDFERVYVDNITTMSLYFKKTMDDLNVQKINLQKVANIFETRFPDGQFTARFQPETYSALIIKGGGSTNLLYSTGRNITIASRSLNQVQNIHDLLKSVLEEYFNYDQDVSDVVQSFRNY